MVRPLTIILGYMHLNSVHRRSSFLRARRLSSFTILPRISFTHHHRHRQIIIPTLSTTRIIIPRQFTLPTLIRTVPIF